MNSLRRGGPVALRGNDVSFFGYLRNVSDRGAGTWQSRLPSGEVPYLVERFGFDDG